MNGHITSATIRIKMTRADGRSALQSRAPKLVNGIIANSCGSASVELGGNKVVCSVRGPLQLTTEYRGNKGKIVCNVSYAPFARSKGPRIDPQGSARGGVSCERQLAFILEGICEQVVILESFPQLYYELNFIVLSSEGSNDLPALCASASSALLEAGVEMTDLFTASSAALLGQAKDSEATIIVDPTQLERSSASAICYVASGTSTGKALYISHEGAASPETIAQLFKHATAGCLSQRSSFVEWNNIHS